MSLSYIKDKIPTPELPFDIAPIPLFIGCAATFTFYLLIFIFGGLNSGSVINAHKDILASTSVYIEERSRDQEVIGIASSFSDAPDGFDTTSNPQRTQVDKISQSRINNIYAEIEPGKFVPVASKDGDTVFKAFQKSNATPSSFENSGDTPKISLVMLDAGLKSNALQSVYKNLPRSISLAFSPYANDLEQKIKTSFNQGFESWLMLPIETRQFPLIDPGPLVFLQNVNPTQNTERLTELVSSTTHVVGLVGTPKAIALKGEQERDTLSKFLKNAGMGYIHDTRNTDVRNTMVRQGIPFENARLIIDSTPTPDRIQIKLKSLINLAKAKGKATAYFHPYPSTIKEIKSWAQTLEDMNIKLVSASQQTN